MYEHPAQYSVKAQKQLRDFIEAHRISATLTKALLNKLHGNSNSSVAPLQDDLNNFGIFVGGGQGIDGNPFGPNQNHHGINEPNESQSGKVKKEISDKEKTFTIDITEEKKNDKSSNELLSVRSNDFGGVFIGHD